jgi:ABC-type glycerol-3-phosphate transport system permease component
MPSWDRLSFMLVFLGVPLAVYIIFVIYPFGQALYYSMTDWSGFTPTYNFTGLDNFDKLLHDDLFRRTLRNNIELAIVVPFVLALAIASVVTVAGPSKGTVRGIRGSGFYRVVSFFPYAVPAIVIGLIWAQVYDPSAGILNASLTKVGLHGFENFAWLGDTRTAMPASMFVIIWSFVGFYTVLFVAAIKGIPAEIYEAARMDGPPDPGHRADGLHLPRDHGPRRLRLHAGAEPERRPRQPHADDEPGPLQHGVPQGSVRLCHGHGRRARGRDAVVRRDRVHDQPSHRRQREEGAPMTAPTTDLALEERDTTAKRSEWTGGDRAVEATSHVLLALWSIIVIVPFLWVVLSSFKTTKEILASPFSLPAHWGFDNYVNAWTDAGIRHFFLNTIIVVGAALALVMLLGSMCAYVLARFVFPGARFIYFSMLAGLTFPIFLAIVPLFFILKNGGLLNTLPGLIMVYVAFALPFTVFFLFAFFRGLPDEVYEAALMDGAGDWRIFFQIMLPMARPGIAAVAIFNFLGLWNQFLLPVALNTDQNRYVLTQGMASFASQAGYAVDFGALFAAVVITVVPVLIVYLIFQRRLEGSVSQGTFR